MYRLVVESVMQNVCETNENERWYSTGTFDKNYSNKNTSIENLFVYVYPHFLPSI